MNTSMNGRKIATIALPTAGGGLEYFHGSFELEATHHGDHDQFWVVVKQGGIEVARYNANYVAHIEWEKT